MKYNRRVRVERKPESDSSGSNYSIPGVENTEDNSNTVIIAEYWCKVKDKLKLESDDQGESYKSKGKMYGELTDQIKHEDLLIDLDTNERFKVIGKTRITKDHTIARVVRV